MPSPHQKFLDALHEISRIERLAQAVVKTGRQQFLALTRHCRRADGDRGYRAQSGIALQCADEAVAAALREMNAAQDQRRLLAARDCDSLAAVDGRQYLIAAGF